MFAFSFIYNLAPVVKNQNLWLQLQVPLYPLQNNFYLIQSNGVNVFKSSYSTFSRMVLDSTWKFCFFFPLLHAHIFHYNQFLSHLIRNESDGVFTEVHFDIGFLYKAFCTCTEVLNADLPTIFIGCGHDKP